MRIKASLLVGVLAILASEAVASPREADLNVAIFAYLPDASAAIEKLEDAFESRYSSIDLDLELWNPYDDSLSDDGLSQIVDFDVVEIDTCRIDELMNGAFGGIDEIPAEVRRAAPEYVGPAKAISATDIGRFVHPHWVCGNFLQIWSTNTAVVNAVTFSEFLHAVDSTRRPVLAGMWGSTGLGEYYADAHLDLHGPERTRDHLIALNEGSEDLEPKARDAVLSLIKELAPSNQANLSHFYNHSYVFPREFAAKPDSPLIGYSERLYYTERELQLVPDQYPPTISPDELVVRQFAFGNTSQGTPSWVDGFVIPKGKLAPKHAAIVAFLQFIQTEEAYLAFAEPTQYLAASYLLPATAASYDSDSALVAKQPLLPEFLAALGEEFPVADSRLWQGIRSAGKKLRGILDR